MNKLIKKRRSKGTVLYTVVSIMSVMLLFVVITLALAKASSDRAYNDYNSNQALYTARSAVDAVAYNLEKQAIGSPSSLRSFVNTVGTGGEVVMSVDLPSGMGKIQAVDGGSTPRSPGVLVEYAGKDVAGTENFYGGTGQSILKLTAAVKVGGVTEEYSKYILMGQVPTPKPAPSAGFVPLGGSADINGVRVYGPQKVLGVHKTGEIDSDAVIRFKGGGQKMDSGETQEYAQPVSIEQYTKLILNPGTHLKIAGNLTISENGQLDGEMKTNDALLQSRGYPYIYAEGTVALLSGSIALTTKNINIYCGQYIQRVADSGAKNTTVFCLNPYVAGETQILQAANNVQHTGITGLSEINSGQAFNLAIWTETLTTPINAQPKSFYSRGRLKLDIPAANSWNSVKLTDFVVSGGIEGSGFIEATGAVFFDPDKSDFSQGITINGQQYTLAKFAPADAAQSAYGDQVFEEFIRGKLGYSGTSKADYIAAMNSKLALVFDYNSSGQPSIVANDMTSTAQNVDDFFVKDGGNLVWRYAKDTAGIWHDHKKSDGDDSLNGGPSSGASILNASYDPFHGDGPDTDPTTGNDDKTIFYEATSENQYDKANVNYNAPIFNGAGNFNGTQSMDMTLINTAPNSVTTFNITADSKINFVNCDLSNCEIKVINPDKFNVTFYFPEKGEFFTDGVNSATEADGNVKAHMARIRVNTYNPGTGEGCDYINSPYTNVSGELTELDVQKKIYPYLFIYMSGTGTFELTPPGVNNSSTVTAFVRMPYATVYGGNGFVSYPLTYNGTSLGGSDPLVIIGQLVCGQFRLGTDGAQTTVAYINPDPFSGGGGGGGSGTLGSDWSIIRY